MPQRVISNLSFEKLHDCVNAVLAIVVDVTVLKFVATPSLGMVEFEEIEERNCLLRI